MKPANTTETRQRVQRFIGEFAWMTLILACFVLLTYSILTFKTLTAQMSLTTTTVLAASLYYMGYTVLHEAVHGSINGKNHSLKWVNDVLGYVIGQMLCVSYCVHKNQHLKNHGHRDKPAHDKNVGLIRDAVSVARLQYQNFFTTNWNEVSRREQIIVLTEVATMIAWRLVTMVYFSSYEIMIFFIGSVTLGICILIVLFIWCVHPAKLQENRYRNTITIIFPKCFHTPLTWLWLYQNYHIIHHLFPCVPFYHYKTLFHEIEDELIVNDALIIRLWAKQ